MTMVLVILPSLPTSPSLACLSAGLASSDWTRQYQAAAGASVQGEEGRGEGESIGSSRPGGTFTQLHLLPSHYKKHAPNETKTSACIL